MPTVASYCTTFLKPEMLHVYRQVTGLKEWRTFVVCKERLCEEKYPFGDVEIAPRVRSNFLRRFWLKYIRREPPIVYRGEYGVLAKLLGRREADVLHVYFGHTGVHLLPFLKRWPKPAVVSFHGMDVQTRADKPGYEQNLRELLQVATLVLVRSESLAERVMALGCPQEKVRLNRTGIPMEAFPFVERKRPENGAWRFVQACRLIEKKGLDTALRAFASFSAEHPAATFTIAGEGPLRAELENLAAELGVIDKVRWAGFLAESALSALCQRCHVFVHPSQMTEDQNQEGIPNSMLEGMATGLPVLATLHGGIPEAVKNNVTGLLVPERDFRSLAAAMHILHDQPGLWERFSRAAADDVRANFGHAEQIRRLESYYAEAMERGATRRRGK